MKCAWIMAATLCMASLLPGQSPLPAGSVIPLSLDTGLDARKDHPGKQIRATVMQDVPGTSIRRRDQVLGHVVSVSNAKDGKLTLAIRFDSIRINGSIVPLKASLRALASYLEVEQAQDPEDNSDRGLTPATWTTQQIGGEQVYRGGGHVDRGTTRVGEPTPWGVLAIPRTQPGLPCRGVVGDNTQPQALWLFSSDACGVYGLEDIFIAGVERENPEGTIVLFSIDGKMTLRSGSGLLLRVS